MDVLWSKERLQKIFSKDSLSLTVAHASGDGAGRFSCCRLCGGDVNLRCFTDTYMWEGVEEKYDQLLLDCFGIRVLQPDCMICEYCVQQLRNLQRFRSLVYAAFVIAPSEYSTKQSQLGVSEGYISHRINNQLKLSKIELYKKSTRTTIDHSLKKSQCRERQSIFDSKIQIRRMNVACTVCRQKFPMIVPFEGAKKFVCSRCKKKSEPRNSVYKKCTVLMPQNMMKDHRALYEEADQKSKTRVYSFPKKSSQMVRNESFARPKYYCTQCGKKYAVAEHLAHHISTVHRKSLDCICSVCGKDLKTHDLLDRHMRMHTGQSIYQCDVCMRVYKGKQAFQTHYWTHGQ